MSKLVCKTVNSDCQISWNLCLAHPDYQARRNTRKETFELHPECIEINYYLK